MTQGYWYLATPYSKFPGGHEAAFDLACENAALLLNHRISTFCPIAHSHPLVNHGLKAVDHDFWINVVDRPMMEGAKGLIFLEAESWAKSSGMHEEIVQFVKDDKPVVFMTPGVVPEEFRTLVVGDEMAIDDAPSAETIAWLIEGDYVSPDEDPNDQADAELTDSEIELLRGIVANTKSRDVCAPYINTLLSTNPFMRHISKPMGGVRGKLWFDYLGDEYHEEIMAHYDYWVDHGRHPELASSETRKSFGEPVLG